ncbi:MAG: type II secretion system F family protein [Alphaproteobacteria bacterium]|uniref:Type II secretion system F family protein n=1 Tax=Candidatus Nitrobium versatile TaxID=2884831 RepID=A0A953M1C8_9BACT|nr:type II secretion system F family protein [Candidatus Nitrobium versatile]
MTIFSYRATTREGAVVEGVIEALDERTAVERLRATGIIPLSVTAPKKGVRRRFSVRFSRGDLLTFTTELSALLSAGLPLDRSLNILSEISESSEMKGIVQSILKSIREGSAFSEALQKHPETFPRLYVNMIRAGEAGGVLDVVLDKLNEFLETTKELKEHVFSAMIYPAILVTTGGLSILVLLTYVLPKFSVIFSELGTSLPVPTQVLLTVSTALKTYWWGALLLIIGSYLVLRSSIRTDEGRKRWDSLKLKLLGSVIVKLETARFCRTLGTLLKSGVPLLQALNNSRDVISNRIIASAVDSVSKGVKEGKGIAVPLSNAGVFPPLALSMIKVGEETGQLDTMLIKVASTYEKSLKVAIKRFVGFIEPAMILGMGVVIGFIVLSMLMAIFSITEIPF